MRASLTIDLPGSISLDDRDALVVKAQELGSAELSDDRTLEVYWEATDGWDLRGLVEEALDDLETFIGTEIVERSHALDRIRLDVTR